MHQPPSEPSRPSTAPASAVLRRRPEVLIELTCAAAGVAREGTVREALSGELWWPRPPAAERIAPG